MKSRYCFVLGDVAKKTFENIRKRFNKARNKMMKAKKSGTSTQEAMEAAGDVNGCEYLMWLVPYIAVRKTKSNITSINSSTENEPLSKAKKRHKCLLKYFVIYSVLSTGPNRFTYSHCHSTEPSVVFK